jgi:type IX secretion system PorP/SprF family membrane protein
MGQSIPVYSQYIINGLLINPAYAGSRDVLSTVISYRDQWTGFPGTPVTQTLTGHMPLQNKSLALGLIITNESIGVINNTGIFGNYAYRVRLNSGMLAFGVKAGVQLYKENDYQLYIKDPGDYVFSNNGNYILPNFGAGVYYYNSTCFAGLSLPTILSYRESPGGNSYDAYNNAQNYNFMFFGGCLINVTDEFKLKPSALLQYTLNSGFQYDLNLNAILLKDGLLSVGTSYREKDAIAGMVEVQLNTQLRIGYSYDFTINTPGNYSGGTHEITIRYEFKYIVNALNPRFF